MKQTMLVITEKKVKVGIDHFHQSIQPDDCMFREIVEGTVRGTLPYSASGHQQNRGLAGRKGENW
jgi:hypothetical protein